MFSPVCCCYGSVRTPRGVRAVDVLNTLVGVAGSARMNFRNGFMNFPPGFLRFRNGFMNFPPGFMRYRNGFMNFRNGFDVVPASHDRETQDSFRNQHDRVLH
jgi:hypothetical protein